MYAHAHAERANTPPLTPITLDVERGVFSVLLGGEGQGTQSHVTLVTNWFALLKETLPGS